MISACMMVQDEEECIDRCLSNIHDYVDEIVIIDGGSMDSTKEIASGYAKVSLYEIPFENDFSKQRNNAIEKASNEWIFIIDADEYCYDYVLKELSCLAHHPDYKQYDAFAFTRKTLIDGRFMNRTDLDYHIRLFKKKCRYMYDKHEQVTGFDNLCYTNMEIIHDKTLAWQQKDNERVWDMGQEPPEGWFKLNGKWHWIGELGYDVPDKRFWLDSDPRQGMEKYESEEFRKVYNIWMPREQPVLDINQIGYSPGEYPIIEEIKTLIRPVHLLDVGCANGSFGYSLIRDNIIDTFTGIDVSDEEIEIGKQTGIKTGLYRNSFLSYSDLESYESEQKFSVVTMNECLEHVYSVHQALRKVCSLITDDGVFAGTVPYFFECNAGTHLHYFSISSLSAVLSYFFKDVKVIKVNYYDTAPEHTPEYHLAFICKNKL